MTGTGRRTRIGSIVLTLILGIGAVATTTATAGAQKGGGDLRFGLEAETTDYCLTRAQLAISGIQVASAIYDTLTVPNAKGEMVPYLAKSVTPSDDLATWTITLRPGVTFHDGTPLDADAVKLNLDSYRGAPGAPNTGDLFLFYFKFVDDVRVVDPQTVEVALSTPVADFASYLYGEGRIGIMAPAQLNAGQECSTKLIGTGPFVLDEYRQNEKTVVTKNPDYWQDGYPKADSITFVPVPEATGRVSQLQGGDLDLLHTDNALQLERLRDLGGLQLLTQKPGLREIHYYFLLTGQPPFDDVRARQAVFAALDRKQINQIRTDGLWEIANSVMDRDTPGYEKNAGYPKHDVKAARELADAYKADHGGEFSFVIATTQDAESQAEMQLVQQQLAKVGIDAQIAVFDQATQINKALSGDIQLLEWRNLHGGIATHADESNYVWFSNADAGNLVNFGQFSDPDTQAALDAGRAETDVAKLDEIYRDFNEAMAKQVFLVPMWFVTWTVAAQPDVSLKLPALPDGGGKPLFVYGRIPVLGLTGT